MTKVSKLLNVGDIIKLLNVAPRNPILTFRYAATPVAVKPRPLNSGCKFCGIILFFSIKVYFITLILKDKMQFSINSSY